MKQILKKFSVFVMMGSISILAGGVRADQRQFEEAGNKSGEQCFGREKG